MLVVASLVLLAALPMLLWPLLKPPPEVLPVESPEAAHDAILQAAEELELDLASGRLDREEADRRLAELRQVQR